MAETMVTSSARAPLLDPAAIRSRVMGRSYWALLMTDGTIIPEWECDWPLAPLKGRRALRLYTPNGEMATLDDGKDATGRLFQFKCAIASAGSIAGRSRATLAHVVGLVWGTDGQCSCAAYEYTTRRLLLFTDNVNDFRYQNVGKVHADHVGISPA
jgi:hypothetical protein